MSDESTDGFPVGVDFRRILDTIASRIYDNPFAFLRENVQNAIDAIRMQAHRDQRPVESPEYIVSVVVSGTECRISDTGIGMNKRELQVNFWTMGASGKTTAEAKNAGCIGTFGIGGFANFGVCTSLEVVSTTKDCSVTHKTTLSRSDFETGMGSLPKVRYETTEKLPEHGTLIIGRADSPFDSVALKTYLTGFVSHVREAVFFNGEKISQRPLGAIGDNYRPVTERTSGTSGSLSVTFQLFADEGNNLAVKLLDLEQGGFRYMCSGFVRLVGGGLDVFKRGFKLCAISVSSRIGVSGVIDSDLPKPTAGRDTLDADSLSLLTQIFKIIEARARAEVIKDEELLANHIRLLPDILAQGDLESLNLLRINTLDDESHLLQDLRDVGKGKRLFYTTLRNKTSAAEVLQTRGDKIVMLSGDATRRRAEVMYLQKFCGAQEFDNLIEQLETYSNLDSFERAILGELDIAIRRLFRPDSFRFLAGRLTLEVPIYWSNKKESGQTLVYVDTRHGEFQKLRPLGFTPLLWSMVEAFCREYLGDTLKRQSTKFFGSGAINLDALAKSHAELWELVSSEIETSLLEMPVSQRTSSHGGGGFGRVEVVRAQDVTEVHIGKEGQNKEDPSDVSAQPAGKLLHIIDKTGTTGLGGYYIRLPMSATLAFGDIIRTFPSFAVVWFANHVTWTGTDKLNTAFMFNVALDRIIGNDSEPSFGASNLDGKQLQVYKNQLYVFIPLEIQSYFVPVTNDDGIKVSVTHELIDLERSRAWIAKDDNKSVS